MLSAEDDVERLWEDTWAHIPIQVPRLFNRGVILRPTWKKTELLSYLDMVLDAECRFVCVSRPRRFGKTMAANMACACYARTVGGTEELVAARNVALCGIACDPKAKRHLSLIERVSERVPWAG